MVLTGRCLCGDITFAVEGELRDVIECHCPRCRRFTGHFMAASNASVDAIRLTGNSLAWFAPADGGGVEYGFCPQCGSSLFWRSAADAPTWSIAAGTLDPPTGLRTVSAWWTSTRSDYFESHRGLVEHEHDG